MSYPAHIVTIFNFHSSDLKTWRITENLEFSFWSNSLYPIIHLYQSAYISLSMICPWNSISDVCTVSHSKVILISWLYDSIYNFLNNFTLLILFFLCCSEQSFQHFFLKWQFSLYQKQYQPVYKTETGLCFVERRRAQPFSRPLCQMDSTEPWGTWEPFDYCSVKAIIICCKKWKCLFSS